MIFVKTCNVVWEFETVNKENSDKIFEKLFASRQEELAVKFDQLLERRKQYGGLRKDCVFIQTFKYGTDDVSCVRFEDVSKADLEGRKFRWEYWNHQVAIQWLDVLYDPKTRKTVPATVPDEE